MDDETLFALIRDITFVDVPSRKNGLKRAYPTPLSMHEAFQATERMVLTAAARARRTGRYRRDGAPPSVGTTR